jgi:hypothetical protein
LEAEGWSIADACRELWERAEAGQPPHGAELARRHCADDASAAVVLCLARFAEQDAGTEWRPPGAPVGVRMASNPLAEPARTRSVFSVGICSTPYIYKRAVGLICSSICCCLRSDDVLPMACVACGLTVPDRAASREHTAATGHTAFRSARQAHRLFERDAVSFRRIRQVLPARRSHK